LIEMRAPVEWVVPNVGVAEPQWIIGSAAQCSVPTRYELSYAVRLDNWWREKLNG
jgi:hypothetical protein